MAKKDAAKRTGVKASGRKSGSPAIDIGISHADRAKIAKGLSALLADSYALYLMTHNFHLS